MSQKTRAKPGPKTAPSSERMREVNRARKTTTKYTVLTPSEYKGDKQLKDLIASLRRRAHQVAVNMRRRKKKNIERAVVAIALCQHCGNIIPTPSASSKYCNRYCKMLANRIKQRFAAARLLSKRHTKAHPMRFYVCVDVVDLREVRAAKGNV